MTHFDKLLLSYGLLQFGRFTASDATVRPFKLNLDLMPSYPDALQAATDAIASQIKQQRTDVDRLLCPFESVPLATLVSQQTGIPLVWSHGRDEAAVHDLVGAYDVNHPTFLLMNSDEQPQHVADLITKGGRVGLNVTQCYAVVRTGGITETRNRQSIDCIFVTEIAALISTAQAEGYISEEFVEHIRRWWTAVRKA